MKHDYRVLLAKVLTQLGHVRISEQFIRSEIVGERHYQVEGLAIGHNRVVVNPVPGTVDTVIHEILHHLRPDWDESTVRRYTSFLMRRITDGELKTIYEAFKRASIGPSNVYEVED